MKIKESEAPSNEIVTASSESSSLGCPCTLVKPCRPDCTCANSQMSGGCGRCSAYGSVIQRLASATRLAAIIDNAKSRKHYEVDADINLVFDNWRRNGENIYATEEGIGLRMGNMHSGTVFHGVIRLRQNEHQDLIEAAETGAYARMRVILRETP